MKSRLWWRAAARKIWGRIASFRRALERCVELIGEAATRLPEAWRASYRAIPWRQIIAMRNVMIHGYDEVIDVVLWDVATKDVPLRELISGLL